MSISFAESVDLIFNGENLIEPIEEKNIADLLEKNVVQIKKEKDGSLGKYFIQRQKKTKGKKKKIRQKANTSSIIFISKGLDWAG